jgi:catecholate siderophore receptor
MRRPSVCLLSILTSSLLALSPASAQVQVADLASAASGDVQALPGHLKGRVLDATGGPVGGASVTVRRAGTTDAPITIVTDGYGQFDVPLAPGVYSVVIASPGFVGASQRIDIGAGTDRTVDVVLRVAGISEVVNVDASLVDSPRAVVSATKTPTPLRDVPQAVSIVTSQQMADQRMASMADVVRYMPGVSMAQGEGNRDTPILRGSSSTSDFFVDGVRDDVQYMRDVYNLERVEALKGPNAMIFGRGGAGGVINRVTRQAQWGQSQEFSAQIGSFDNRRVTADVGKGFTDAVAARVTGVYEDSGSYRNGVGLERYGVQPSVAFRLSPQTLLRASYEYFHDERVADRGIPSLAGSPVETDASTFFGDPDLSRVDATVNLLAAVVEHDFNDRVTLRNRVSYGVYDKFYQNVFPGGVNATAATVSIAAYNNATDRANLFNQTDLVVRQQTGTIAHTILAGAEFGRQVTDNFRSTGYFTGAGPNVTSVQAPLDSPTISLPVQFRQSATDADNHGVATVAAVYLQDQLQLTSHWQAVAGLRLDAFDLDFTNNRSGVTLASRDRLLSPRLGVVYKPILPVSIYGSYTLTYIPRSGDQLSSLSLSNQALEPEQFRNYEAGVKWDVGQAVAVTGAVYRLDRGNVAIADPNDTTRSILVDAQRTVGLELEMNGTIGALGLSAGYAWQDGEITRAISPSVPAGSVLAQLPKHSVSLWSKYAVTDRWAAALGVVHRSGMFAAADNAVTLPGFTRVDGGVFFDVNARLRAQVNVENLFDADYFASAHNNNNITPGGPRGVRFSLTARY